MLPLLLLNCFVKTGRSLLKGFVFDLICFCLYFVSILINTEAVTAKSSFKIKTCSKYL